MEVGWLGLGAMGLPMARRLAGVEHRVTAYDPRPGRAAGVGGGVVPTGSAAEAGAAGEAVVVMVATPAQAEETLFGPGAAASALRPGARLFVMGTLGRSWVAEAAGRLPAGTGLVDAPVSGGVGRAADGTLLIMAAGATDADRAFLAPLGEVVDVGAEPGQGQAMKLVNQVLCGIHIAAAAEALALAESLGIDPVHAWRTLRKGAAASFMLDDRGDRMVNGRREPVVSALSLFTKDLQLVLDEAEAARLPVGVVGSAARLFAAAAENGNAPHDDSELFDFVRSLRGRAE